MMGEATARDRRRRQRAGGGGEVTEVEACLRGSDFGPERSTPGRTREPGLRGREGPNLLAALMPRSRTMGPGFPLARGMLGQRLPSLTRRAHLDLCRHA